MSKRIEDSTGKRIHRGDVVVITDESGMVLERGVVTEEPTSETVAVRFGRNAKDSPTPASMLQRECE